MCRAPRAGDIEQILQVVMGWIGMEIGENRWGMEGKSIWRDD